jgi:hypothetical protein
MNRGGVWFVGIVVVAVGVFLFFFFRRYQYVNSGVDVTRVDRLTGAMCVMRCLGPLPTPTAPPLDLEAQRAIAMVRERPDATSLATMHGEGGYQWSAFTAKSARQFGSGEEPYTYVVCYCNDQTDGWRWEAHLNTSESTTSTTTKISR